MTDYERWEEIYRFAADCARQAGAMQRGYRSITGIETKEKSYDLVTHADVAIEDYITNSIRGRFPDHGVLGEERQEVRELAAPRLWIVDPIDGTTNFVHSIPVRAVSIAYAEAGSVKVGVCYDPDRDELFHAIAGAGAFLNGEPIGVSKVDSLQSAIIAVGFYYDRGERMEQTLAALRELFSAHVHGIRRLGAAVIDLCWTAAGRFDGYFEHRLNVWDWAAAALVLREAGGRYSRLDGTELQLSADSMVAGNIAIHKLVVDITQRVFGGA